MNGKKITAALLLILAVAALIYGSLLGAAPLSYDDDQNINGR